MLQRKWKIGLTQSGDERQPIANIAKEDAGSDILLGLQAEPHGSGIEQYWYL